MKGSFVLLKTKNISFWETPNIFLRYRPVLKELCPEWSVLEVGAGSHGLSEFFTGKLIVVDIKKTDMQAAAAEGLLSVVGDGTALPFKDNSFDAVVSVASYEHIPKQLKKKYLQEMARVARKKVIVYCPFGRTARFGDKIVFNLRRLAGIFDNQTVEHLREGIVSRENFDEVLPGACITGKQNVFCWLITSLAINVPFFNKFLAGFLHLVFLQWFNWLPPYYAAIISWRKENG